MVKLDESLEVRLGRRLLSGTVIGIDRYHLENFAGKDCRWTSYTLVSKKGGPFKRYWITDWKKSGWILWQSCKKKADLKSYRLVIERSGVTGIEFSGDQGVSTPSAAVVVYQHKDGSFYAMERFSDSAVMFFSGKQIVKI